MGGGGVRPNAKETIARKIDESNDESREEEGGERKNRGRKRLVTQLNKSCDTYTMRGMTHVYLHGFVEDVSLMFFCIHK